MGVIWTAKGPGISLEFANKLRVDVAIYTSEFFDQNSAFARPDMPNLLATSVPSLEPQDCKQGPLTIHHEKTKMQIQKKESHEMP